MRRTHYQYTPNDDHDYDEIGSHILIDTKVNGEDLKGNGVLRWLAAPCLRASRLRHQQQSAQSSMTSPFRPPALPVAFLLPKNRVALRTLPCVGPNVTAVLFPKTGGANGELAPAMRYSVQTC
jgi:hypothetical protein